MNTPFNYYKVLKNGYIIKNSKPENAKGLAALQKIVFPLLSDEEIFTEDQYREHIKMFPEGQFVVMDGDKVIGMSTTMRSNLILEHHTFLDVFGEGKLENHNPKGDWLYGLDVGVNPAYRGKGFGREIYRARQELVKFLGLKGQYTVGMINGYHKLKNLITQREYFDKLVQKEITDPTISVQEKFGFKIIHLIENYLDDPTCGNAGVLLTMDANNII